MKFLAFLMIFTLTLFAYEQQTACVAYRTQNSWSSKYKVNGFIYSGHELNTKIRSLNFDSLKRYFVIFWCIGEASIIKIDDFYLGGRIIFDLKGFDERGVGWMISPPNSCF